MTTISWRRLGGPADLPVMDAWCSGVGPALAAARDPVLGALPGAVDSLVIVTWNVNVGGGDLIRFTHDLRAGKLTRGAPVGDFVLLLQEAHRSGPDVPAAAPVGPCPRRIAESPPSGERMDVVEAARRLGLHILYAPSMRNGPGGELGAEDRGNAILSTLPLGEVEAIELPYEFQRRVAVAGTVGGYNREGVVWNLRMVSAHLDNRTRWSRFFDTFARRGRARRWRSRRRSSTPRRSWGRT